MDFQILLADQVIELHTLYRQTYYQCWDYICKDCKPDFVITIHEEDLVMEKERTLQSDLAEGRNPGQYSDAYLETLAVYRKIADQMLKYHTFLMHGSVIASPLHNKACDVVLRADQEKGLESTTDSISDYAAVMFTARSGVGKTTRTAMWLKSVPGSYVVNGDKPLIRITDSAILACGTPWAGKEKLQRNCMVPLRAILLLERGEENSIEELSFSEAFSLILPQIYKPNNSMALIETMKLVRQMAGHIRFFRFRSNLEKDAIELAYHAVFDNL